MLVCTPGNAARNETHGLKKLEQDRVFATDGGADGHFAQVPGIVFHYAQEHGSQSYPAEAGMDDEIADEDGFAVVVFGMGNAIPGQRLYMVIHEPADFVAEHDENAGAAGEFFDDLFLVLE
ncbi:hypothetical protein QWY86_05335 [Pedobacter aquatilis]|nr:hypothetical protein [Pedobacter aquatilis]MDN3586079.1 hypothetical protein [Pedobacter aquatilis]